MDFRAIGMGLLFALIWSSAFTSARIIVADAPPFAISAIRFAIAGMIGILIARVMGQTWTLTRAQWRATFVFGLCQNALYLGLNFLAMTTVEAPSPRSSPRPCPSLSPLQAGLFSRNG